MNDVDSSYPYTFTTTSLKNRRADFSNSSEFACGAAASFTNVVFTYPISKLVFRQMLQGIPASPALQQIKYEGLVSLYRGVLPPLIQKTLSISLMFGMYDSFLKLWQPIITSKQLEATNNNKVIIKDQITNVHILLASLSAGTIEALTCTPLERMQTLLQHSELQTTYNNTFSTVQKLWGSTLGFREFYRGFTPILLRNGPSTAIFFEFRCPLREFIWDHLSRLFSPTSNATDIGILSPKTNFLNNELPQHNIPKSENSKLYPTIKPPHRKKLTSIEMVSNFVSGALLGGTISTLFYPLNVARARMQSIVGENFLSLPQALRLIYNERDRKFIAFFYGARVNFSRSLISWGIINLSYELYKRILFPVTNDSYPS